MHSWRHFFGLHRSSLTIAIRVNRSAIPQLTLQSYTNLQLEKIQAAETEPPKEIWKLRDQTLRFTCIVLLTPNKHKLEICPKKSSQQKKTTSLEVLRSNKHKMVEVREDLSTSLQQISRRGERSMSPHKSTRVATSTRVSFILQFILFRVLLFSENCVGPLTRKKRDANN